MNKVLSWKFCLLLMLSVSAVSINAQDTFRGIIPFVTTQLEVEQKLGKPNEYGRYELDEGRVYILYRQTECEKTSKRCLCLAPIGTVLSIELQPKYDKYIKDLNLDPGIWERAEVKGGDVPGIEVYTNHKPGMT